MPGPQIVTTRQPLRRGKSEYESPYLLVYMPHTFYIYAEWIYPCCALLVGMGPPQGNRCPIFLFERPCPSYALKRHLPSQNRGTSQNGSLHLLASLSPQEVASKHICSETSTHTNTLTGSGTNNPAVGLEKSCSSGREGASRWRQI